MTAAAARARPRARSPSRTWAAWARALWVRSEEPRAPGELVDDHGADVVAVAGVGRAGVAQPDDEPGCGVVHRSSMPWAAANRRGHPSRTGQGPVRADRALTAVEPCGAVRLGWLRPRRRRTRPRRPRPRQPPRRPPRAPRARCRPRPRPRQLGLEGLLGDLRGDVDDERLGVGDQGGALGQLDLAGEDLGAGGEALDRDGDALGDVGGEHLELEAGVVGGDDGLGGGVALEVHVDVDDDLLAALHDDQVDVLDDRLDRVALHVLGQGELLLAVEDDGEQGVALLQREHRLVAGQGDVHRLAAVAVHDGGDLVVAADLARGTLAELGAGLGDELGCRTRVLLEIDGGRWSVLDAGRRAGVGRGCRGPHAEADPTGGTRWSGRPRRSRTAPHRPKPAVRRPSPRQLLDLTGERPSPQSGRDSSARTATTPATMSAPPRSWSGAGSSASTIQAKSTAKSTSVSATKEATFDPSRRTARCRSRRRRLRRRGR